MQLLKARPDRMEEEGASERWLRRALTIPAYFAALSCWLALLPIAVPVAFAVDGVRGKRSTVLRFWILLGCFAICEIAGLLAAFWLFAAGRARDLDVTFRLQWWWARTLLRITCALFSMKVETSGVDLAREGPVLFLLRHASVGDTLIPAGLVSSVTGLRLRYVLKRELLWDPCLDVVGRRLPNAFVRRDSSDPAHERALVGALAAGLGARDGVLIYPEGTRFSPRLRERAIEKLADKEPALAERARRLEHVLPPRIGGTFALLDAAPSADVVFGAHTGFDGVRRLSDLTSGVLLGRTLRLQMWRARAAEIPKEHDARVAWLHENWARVDAFVARAKDDRT